MKILFATYPMAFHTPGGGEIQLLEYRNALKRRGVEVDLFDCWNPCFDKYDIVHFFSCVGGSGHFCKFVKNVLKKPLVVTSSLWITEESRLQYPIDEIVEQLNIADSIVTNSVMESEQLSKILGIEISKFSHVHNACDDVFFDQTVSNFFTERFDIEKEYFLNVGNFEPRKNQKIIADAAKFFPDYDFIVAGHIRDQDYYKEVSRAAPPNFRYVGPLEAKSEILRSAYKNAKALILPSILETPGLAALEAAAMGVPLILTSEGSTKEYFGYHSSYVNPSVIDSIISAVNVLLDGGGVVGKYNPKSWDSVIPSLIDVYKKVQNVT